MANFKVREYSDEDEEVVKEIFTLGMSEHVPSAFLHMLKQPLTQMVLMCVFCALLASSKSFLLPVLAVTLLLAGVRQMVSYLYTSYIDDCLKDDLGCIRETYMEKRDSCFWVVESDGRVVGMVACTNSGNQECLELKRMSVRKSHRGCGIAKGLCKVVSDFTRDRGYKAVVLSTSMVQTDAQKLYELVGYKKISEYVFPGRLSKIFNFYIYNYRLELQEGTGG